MFQLTKDEFQSLISQFVTSNRGGRRKLPRVFTEQGVAMLSSVLKRDLAELYGVETRVLNQAVRRNKDRFPEDFMFQLSDEETKNWISQIVIPNLKMKMGMRIRPLVFTEHGILMLSSVLKSRRAIHVNIAIMRAFVKLREILSTHKVLAEKLGQLEKRMDEKDKEVRLIFEAIRQLMTEPEKPKGKIGFHV